MPEPRQLPEPELAPDIIVSSNSSKPLLGVKFDEKLSVTIVVSETRLFFESFLVKTLIFVTIFKISVI